jgi:hypothetical protein
MGISTYCSLETLHDNIATTEQMRIEPLDNVRSNKGHALFTALRSC